MKMKEIQKYWKEQREAREEKPYVEHRGGTPDSIAAYRHKVIGPKKGRIHGKY